MENSIAVGIVLKLMQGQRVSATTLSRDYEVSSRTIYRYIDYLSASGVPIICFNGKNGGYEIDSNYCINNNFLSLKEVNFLKNILEKQNDCLEKTVLLQKINSLEKSTI